MEVRLVILICFVFQLKFVDIVHGQSKLIDPPNRSSMWRYGFSTPINNFDNNLNCGGINTFKSNKGKCGLCGDNWSLLPRPNEYNGNYAKGIIGRNYTQGQTIPLTVSFFIGHKGHFEFRICKLEKGMYEATQECFDSHLLTLSNGSSNIYVGSTRFKNITFNLALPDFLTCDRCVIQWTYITAHMWGCDAMSNQCCFGCGLQERYVNCADVRIEPLVVTTTYSPTTIEHTTANHIIINYNIESTSESTTTTPVQSAKHIQDLLDAQRKQLAALAKLKAEMIKLQQFHSEHDSIPTTRIQTTPSTLTYTATIEKPTTPISTGEPGNLQEFVQAFLSVTKKMNGGSAQSPLGLMDILGNINLFEPTTPSPTSNAEQFIASIVFQSNQPNSQTQPKPYTSQPQSFTPPQRQFQQQLTPGNIPSSNYFPERIQRQDTYHPRHVSPYSPVPGHHQESPMMPSVESGSPIAELLGLSEAMPPKGQQSMFGLDPMTTSNFGVNPTMASPELGGGGGGNMDRFGINRLMMDQFRQMMMPNQQSQAFNPFNMQSFAAASPNVVPAPASPYVVPAPASPNVVPPPASAFQNLYSAPIFQANKPKPKPKPLTIDTISDSQRTGILEKLKIANSVMSKQIPPISFDEKLKAYRMVIDSALKMLNEERDKRLAKIVKSPTTTAAVNPALHIPASTLTLTEITQNQQLLNQQNQISQLRQELERIRNMTVNTPPAPPINVAPNRRKAPMSEMQLLDSLFATGSSTAPLTGGTLPSSNPAHPMHTPTFDFANVNPFTLMGMGGAGMGGFGLMESVMRCEYIGLAEIEWPCMRYCIPEAMTCIARPGYRHVSKRCSTECAAM